MATLSPVVVVATRSPRPVQDVAASVTVVDSKKMASMVATSAADLIRYEPAIVAPRTSTRFGSSGYIIRGIGGNRVAIEVDGVPVSDQFAVGNFANAQRDLVDISVLSRVEVLRGPASTLYGSDAIGGVVSYTTLSGQDLGSDAIRLRSVWRSDDSSLSNSLTAGWSSPAVSVLASVTHREGDQLDAGALAEPADKRDYNSLASFARIDWDLNPQMRLTAIVDQLQRESDSAIQSFLGSGRFRSTTALTGDDEQKRGRYSLNLDARTDLPWADRYRVLAYRQSSDTLQRTVEERAANDLRRSRLFDYRQNATGLEIGGEGSANWFGMEHRFGYGIDFQKSRVTEKRDGFQTSLNGENFTSILLGENFPVRDFPISRLTEVGLYVHDEWTLSDSRWTLIPALRFDSYKLDPRVDEIYLEDNPTQQVVGLRDSRWSPRLGLLFDISNRSNLFAQYSQGFRAPPFQDANIGLDIPLFNIRAIPNPDLKSETSSTLELGWRWQSRQTQLTLSGHYSDYEDFIQSRIRLGVDPQTGLILFQSQNVAAAEIYGVELTLNQTLGVVSESLADVEFDLAIAVTEGRNQESGEKLADISPAEMTLGLSWRPDHLPLTASLRLTAVDAKRGANRVNSLGSDQFTPDSFEMLDLLASYQMGSLATLHGGLFNLTNQTYWRWADVRGLEIDDPLISSLSSPGRNVGLSLSFAW